ncbi:MAG: hypothetical protein K6C33_06595 [Desulfovibrio sp.]|nr:hypothetical protein [Desulfovibrio sp.]
MAQRMRAFRKTWKIVDCSRQETLPDVKGFESFRKLKPVRSAVFGEDLCPRPSKLRVCTLEGDLKWPRPAPSSCSGCGRSLRHGPGALQQTYGLLDGPCSRPEGPIKGYSPTCWTWVRAGSSASRSSQA